MNRLNGLYHFIVYYRGDPNTLSVATLCDATSYEERDYKIASDKRFHNEAEAVEYCLYLAKKHGKEVKVDLDYFPKLD